ncbi:LysR family transcriptional regulator [Rhizobium sp. CCGE531]|nr:LysR family transcriptional regulator [Rhizobium sp. CCGE531]AYG66667.1 LysR family transcriptional regulator [Rhizobium sp. CCGE531]AYG73047.1 LysR family transcriptional regulator [Rhizobium sp. CCGE532]
MKKYRTTLPPLDTLVFFEAAYRMGSFTASAVELNVTQAAVSKRIKQLEDWIGEALFRRDGKRLFPTPMGDRLFQTAQMTLEFVQRGLSTLRQEAHRPLSIGANTAVGMFWLTPLLRDFGLSPNACPTRLITSDNPRDLFNDGNDLTVTYGDGHLPGRQVTLLFEEELTPVAAPHVALALGKELRSIHDIPAADRPKILNYRRASPDWVDWQAWFERMSYRGFETWHIETLSTYSQSIGDAIKGNGIALGSIGLLRAELEAGILHRIGQDALLSGRGYYLSYDDRSALTDGARNLIDHLGSAARTARTILPA